MPVVTARERHARVGTSMVRFGWSDGGSRRMQSPPAAGRERQYQPSVRPETAKPAPRGLRPSPWDTFDQYL